MRDIILNEATKASALIAGTATVDDIHTAVSLVARYDVLAAQIPPEEAAGHVKQIIKRLFPDRNPSTYENYIKYSVENAANRPLVKIEGVPITANELDVICRQNGIRAKCLLFAMLAIAKFETARNPLVNNWLDGDLRFEAVRRANLTLSDGEMADMCHPFYKEGLIEFPKRFDSCSMHMMFADPGGEAVIWLNEQDFRDLGYCLRAYLGEPYIRCGECGRWIKQAKNGRRRFCSDCSADNHRNIMRERQKNRRK